MTKTTTSHDHPIRVDWTRTALWPSHLGLTLAPGKKGLSQDGQTLHDRDLETDLTRLRQHAGVQTLVNLLEPAEAERVVLADYDRHAEVLGMDVLHHPVPDVDVPQDRQAFGELVDEVLNRLLNGETVVVHCLGGLGRAGTLAACLLVQAGMPPEQAIGHVREVRPGAIETPEQRHFLEQFGA